MTLPDRYFIYFILLFYFHFILISHSNNFIHSHIQLIRMYYHHSFYMFNVF